MAIVYIGIGSNLGDRLAACEQAVALLRQAPGIAVQRLSPWYVTSAVPVAESPAEDAPDFLNGCAELSTSLEPQELLAALQAIEARMGRPAARPKGAPRAIDLDLLLVGNTVLTAPGLHLPHPELAKRLFVLIPLCAIAPGAVDPVSGCTAEKLLQRLEREAPDQRVELLRDPR